MVARRVSFNSTTRLLTDIGFILKPRDNPTFDFLWALTIGSIFAIYILWDRRYRHKWQQFRAKDWPQALAKFLPGSGEVVQMMKGRSKSVAGYEAWLYYEYHYDGEQEGLYRRFFPTRPEAETFLKLLEGQQVSVRVAPRKPSKSHILDRDVELLINRLGANS
jgi:hypothetical protein